MEKNFDVVARPSHYAEGRKYEPKDVIRDWNLNFNLGSAVKYISRAGRKDDILQDLRKAIQFIQFEIDAIEEERVNLFEGRAGSASEERTHGLFQWNFKESSYFIDESIEEERNRAEEHNRLFIEEQERYFNEIVKSKKFVSLNEIAEGLGFKRNLKYIGYGFDEEFKIDYSNGFVTLYPVRFF